jgi:RNA polymerase sigma factor (sigma-70 family)
VVAVTPANRRLPKSNPRPTNSDTVFVFVHAMTVDSADRLLRDYLVAETYAEVEARLASILEDFAKPIIRRIVASVLRGPAARDAEDVVSDTLARLLRRLRELKSDPSAHPIHDLRGYVATAAYNSCHERLRETYPARNRLRNQLHYLLNHHPAFAIWRTGHGRFVCGNRRWIGQPPGSGEWLGRFSLGARSDLSAQNRAQIVALVEEVFRQAGAPMEVDALVDAIAQAIHLEEERTEPSSSDSEPSRSAAIDSHLELRMSLRQLWDDVRQLPPRQRTALLLSLRDLHGRELLSFLPYTRTATIAQIAEALQIPAARLAGLWKDLPLDDVTIGQLLGASRQQVIKLRRLARERLRRSSKRREQRVTVRPGQNVDAEPPSSKSGLDLTTKLGRTAR